MSSPYTIGATVQVEANPFRNAANAPADPTTVTLTYTPPGSAPVVLVYGTDAAVIRDGVGIYHVDLVVTLAGTWTYLWSSTGDPTTSGGAQFVVLAAFSTDTVTTVADLYARSLRRIGARTGTLGTVAVAAETTAVLNGLINTTADDQGFPSGDRLVFLQSVVGSQETLITEWDDSLGLATFDNLVVAPAAGDAYIAVNREDYTLNELDYAFAEALREGRPTYRQVIPLTPNLDLYPLTACNWLRGGGDVDAVWINESPIMVHNEDFALWWAGDTLPPDGYTLAGAGASVSKQPGGTRSSWLAYLTRAGADASLRQSLPDSLVQWITRRTAPVYTPLRGAAWASTSVAGMARVGIEYVDGGVTSTVWSGYHTGDGVPQFLNVSLTPTETMTAFTLVLEEANVDGAAAWGSCLLMQNTQDAPSAFQIRDRGSQAYLEDQIQKAVRNVGGQPSVELTRPVETTMQLIVYVRRPFPALAGYAAIVDEQYARILEWGLLAWLLRSNKPNQDRSRLDLVMADCQREWARFLAVATDLPVPRPPQRAEIWGA